ncbi:leukosialin [Erethizon dorsatum]
MPAVLEMALLLLFFGNFWAPLVSPQMASPTATLRNSISLVPDSVTSMGPEMRTSLENSTSNQVLTPTPSAPFRDNEVPSLGASVGTSIGPTVSEPVPSTEDSTKKPSVLLEIANGTSDPAVPIAVNSQGYPTVTGGTMTFNSLETSGGTSESSVTNATSSLETSSGASGLLVTNATNSLETSSRASGTSVTMTTNSPEPSSGASGPPVTTTISSLVTSNVTSRSSVSSTKVSMETTPKLSTHASTRPSGSPGQGQKGMLLVPMLVALLVVIVLVALLLLWHQRQKRRTGVLTLSGGGKRNGVVDAWAGPAQVRDEEAMTEAVGGARGDKGSGVPETEGSAQRPTLTTFFSRRKSHQGSLAMEELKSRPGPDLKGEEEPLVGSEDEAMEGAASEGPDVGDEAAPQRL